MNVLAIILFAIYTVIMIALSIVGSRKTKSLGAFTTGNGSMGIGVVALSLASSFTSAATLISMPGYVYQAGLAGIVYFNIFQTVGLLVGLLVVGRKVRTSNLSMCASSIPQWLRKRYNSKTLGYLFALQSVFLITFMVLIVVLLGELFGQILHMDYKLAVVLVSVYVFAYSLLGGSYTHGWSGMLQSVIMVVIVIWLVIASMPSKEAWDQFTVEIVKEEPFYFHAVNPNGVIFKTPFEVFYCAFLLGFCNVFQPHIFNKALYLRKDRSWTITSILSFVIMSIFNLILFVGFFIRIVQPGLTNLDTLFIGYIMNILGYVATALIFITLVAAAMSTLNGVVVGMCTNLGTEVIPASLGEKKSLRFVRIIVGAVGVVVILLALNPPDFILLIGMWGYNILMASALVPMICSLWIPKVSKVSVIASAITAIVVFIAIMASGVTLNGAWACGWSVPASVVAVLISEGFLLIRRHKLRENKIVD